jgi:hypothetical protein
MDYPHRGPNLSRIKLEGAGGFIYALTPVLIALFGAPLALFAFLAAGAALAPLIHKRFEARSGDQAAGVGGFVLVMGLALLLGDNQLFRVVAAACLVLGATLAALLHAGRPDLRALSIRRYAGD